MASILARPPPATLRLTRWTFLRPPKPSNRITQPPALPNRPGSEARRLVQTTAAAMMVVNKQGLLPPHEQVLGKYREQLERKMKAEGVETYLDLRQKYLAEIDHVRSSDSLPPLPRALLEDIGTETDRPSPTAAIAAAATSSSTGTGNPTPTTNDPPKSTPAPRLPPPQRLSSFINVDSFSKLPTTAAIEASWRARFSTDPNSLSACIPAETFRHMRTNALANPMFVLPLPRDSSSPSSGGIEVHIVQWNAPHFTPTPTALFTSLAAYKLRGEFAVPHIYLTHHLDLLDTSAVVLAQGAVLDTNALSPADARWLLMALQKFYTASTDAGPAAARRLCLLELFTRGADTFNIDNVIAELDSLE